MIKNKLASAVKIAITISTASMSFISLNAFSAESESVEQIERIEVTGSSIKRTDIEGALPITNISRSDIESSGVTSVPDLIAKIPSMQGFTTAGDSVGGGGGGHQTANLRDIGDQYTLVLLNGRRMATQDSSSAVDLNSIPLAAIERVEILTDGASALYGSDAIAGVINFILKKDINETNVTARYDRPQEQGGQSSNFSISTGFGDLNSDGYNFMLSLSHDKQAQLKSSDREFANTGINAFTHNNTDLVFLRTSTNAIPANAYLSFSDGSSRSFNPYAAEHGDCADKNVSEGTTCAYDFTETLEIFPESERNNIFAQGIVELSDSMEFFSTLSFSQYDMTSRIAPYPTGRFVLPIDSAIIQENVIPHLSQAEVDSLTTVKAAWRARPGGNRTDEIAVDTTHFVMGLRGDLEDISYDFAVTYATTDRNVTRMTGYPLEDEFMSLLKSGAVNIFDTWDNLSDEANQAVKSTMYSGLWTTQETSSLAFEGKASMPIFELPAGEVYLGTGFDYRASAYSRFNSDANNAEVILFEEATQEYDLSRETYGVFAETIIPVVDDLEVTAAIRYDSIGGVTDDLRTSDKKVNDSVNDTTYKVSLAYRPSDQFLIRASIGTGFKAPSMREIAEPISEVGVTGSSWACPFSASDPLAAACYSEPLQYKVFQQGYDKLKPETSEQKSVGFVYSPDNSFSLSIDWWQVNLENQVDRLTDEQIFTNPEKYRDLFLTVYDEGEQGDVLAINQAAVNVGQSHNEGIDWQIESSTELDFANYKMVLGGTYIIENETLRVGEDDIFDSSLGKYGTDDEVTFRNMVRLTNTLSHGDFSHSFNVNYKSGYLDKFWAAGSSRIRLADDISTRYAGGTQLNVPSYLTIDYVTKFHINDNLNVNFGINNLFDKAPPLTLRSAGSHQVGYDPRYVDVLGCTMYASASYTF
ncbi:MULTISPECIES: TonB-dependent receptor [unclassified Pseudoalteromonas]|uniref:TonB-dependent receptor n=1 Tax=unclassified Pseudoalteromonas TaxID=194690 RepID=UPI0005A96954|nr:MULTISPECIES: TonB-dependent receptor [unclassified Pseudoalteromonas]